jgi:hypothetical protein
MQGPILQLTWLTVDDSRMQQELSFFSISVETITIEEITVLKHGKNFTLYIMQYIFSLKYQL